MDDIRWLYDLAESADCSNLADDRLPAGWEGKTFCHVLAEDYKRQLQQTRDKHDDYLSDE